MPSSTRSMAPRSGPTSRSSRPTPRLRPSVADVLRLFGMVPEQALVERFACDLEGLIGANARIGLAVSGGPDSLALLLLSAAARPGQVEAATVDHRFRPESRVEAEMVGRVCEQLGLPHAILSARWVDVPE